MRLIVFLLSLQLLGACATVNKDDLFEKKVRCASFTQTAKAQMNSASFETLEQIFYSPKLTTCVAAASKPGTKYPVYELRDVLTGEIIYSYGDTGEPLDDRQKWLNEITAMKQSN
jgi:hypothetical protein